MATPEPAEILVDLTKVGLGAVVTLVGTVVVAFVTRKPAILTVADASMKTLLDGYREYASMLAKSHSEQVASLRAEIVGLEGKVDALTESLDAMRDDVEDRRRADAELKNAIRRLTCEVCDRDPARALLGR